MSCSFGFLGTKKFHNHYSDPTGKLKTERDYFLNNIWDQIETDAIGTVYGHVVDVGYATDLWDKLQQEDDWLQNSNNFEWYGYHDGFIVLDYWGNGNGGYTGYAYINTIGLSDNKTCTVDYAASTPDFDSDIGIRHYLGMEPGHLADAHHTDAAVDAVKQLDGTVTGDTSLMKNFGDAVECYKETNVDQVHSWFSQCAYDIISNKASNRC